jgi:hypothetical protein
MPGPPFTRAGGAAVRYQRGDLEEWARTQMVCALSDCGGSRQKPNDRRRGDVAGFDVGVGVAVFAFGVLAGAGFAAWLMPPF